MVSVRRLLATCALVVVAVVAFAQVELDQSTPRALLKTFPEVMRSGSLADALPALDIDRKPEDNEGSPTPELERTLRHLAEVLDALGVDPSQVPENPGADRLTVQPVRNEFNSLVGNVSLVRNGSRWQFSRETLVDLDAIHTAVFRARSGEGTNGEVAKDVVAPDGLKSPRDTMRTFLTAMNEDRPGEAAAALDLRQIHSVIRDDEGRRLAALLLAILNRTEYIDLSRIPDDPAGEPFLYRSYTQRATGQAVGSIVLARQEDGGWRFTSTTVKELDAIWQTVKEQPLVSGTKDIDPAALDPSAYLKSRFPPQFHGKTLWLENWQWLSLLGLLLGAGVLGHGVRLVVRVVLRRTLTPDQFAANRSKLRTFGRSLSLVIACSVLHAGLASLGLPEWWRATLLVVAKLGWALGGALALSAAWDFALAWWSRRDEAQSGRREKLVVPVLSRLARALLLLLALFVFLAALGVNVTGIVAGLGIGGLVVALAAKDSVENLFGSITVLVESPFQLGDWIRIGEVDGVVEEISLRSTRIRTFQDSLITLPNSRLITAHVENFGRRRRRQVKTKLGLSYSTTVEQMTEFTARVRHLLASHDSVYKGESYAYFADFGESTLDVRLQFFLLAETLNEELRLREEIMTAIIQIAQDMGVTFAFPTRTLVHEPTTPPVVPNSPQDPK